MQTEDAQQNLRKVRSTIAQRLAGRRRTTTASIWDSERKAAWARHWTATGRTSSEIMQKNWKERYEANQRNNRNNIRDIQPAEKWPGYKRTLKAHQTLRKHESSILVQLRTGKIGMRAFLFQRRVPGTNTPLCVCGRGPETPSHLVTNCPQAENERRNLAQEMQIPLPSSARDFRTLAQDPKKAP